MRGTAGVYYFNAENEAYQKEFTGFCNRHRVRQSLHQRPAILDPEGGEGEPRLLRRPRLRRGRGRDALAWRAATPRTRPSSTRQRRDREARTTTASHPRVHRQLAGDRRREPLRIRGQGQQAGRLLLRLLRRAGQQRTTPRRRIANGRAIIKEEEGLDLRNGRQDPVARPAPDGQRGRLLHRLDEPGDQRNRRHPLDLRRTPALGSDIPNNFIRNAGESQVVGTEIELALAATENLFLTLNYGLQDTEARGVHRPAPLGDALTGDGDASGKEAPRVPKHTVTGIGDVQASTRGPGRRLVPPR